ncbi:MAG: DsrE family protein [Chloroflexota bacterium]|nr:DsrE family protein [Chloroflexota bacterium]
MGSSKKKGDTYDLQIIIASGEEDLHRAALGFATAVSGAISGMKVVVFLAMRGSVWAMDSHENDKVALPGFESVAEYVSVLLENGGQIEVCSGCLSNGCTLPVSEGSIRSGIGVAGLTAVAARMGAVPTVTF